jgi:hypothetical protein
MAGPGIFVGCDVNLDRIVAVAQGDIAALGIVDGDVLVVVVVWCVDPGIDEAGDMEVLRRDVADLDILDAIPRRVERDVLLGERGAAGGDRYSSGTQGSCGCAQAVDGGPSPP